MDEIHERSKEGWFGELVSFISELCISISMPTAKFSHQLICDSISIDKLGHFILGPSVLYQVERLVLFNLIVLGKVPATAFVYPVHLQRA